MQAQWQGDELNNFYHDAKYVLKVMVVEENSLYVPTFFNK